MHDIHLNNSWLFTMYSMSLQRKQQERRLNGTTEEKPEMIVLAESPDEEIGKDRASHETILLESDDEERQVVEKRRKEKGKEKLVESENDVDREHEEKVLDYERSEVASAIRKRQRKPVQGHHGKRRCLDNEEGKEREREMRILEREEKEKERRVREGEVILLDQENKEEGNDDVAECKEEKVKKKPRREKVTFPSHLEYISTYICISISK